MQHPSPTRQARLIILAKAKDFPVLSGLSPLGSATKLLTQLEAMPLCETERVSA